MCIWRGRAQSEEGSKTGVVFSPWSTEYSTLKKTKKTSTPTPFHGRWSKIPWICLKICTLQEFGWHFLRSSHGLETKQHRATQKLIFTDSLSLSHTHTHKQVVSWETKTSWRYLIITLTHTDTDTHTDTHKHTEGSLHYVTYLSKFSTKSVKMRT